jgi:hypothetical protein
VSDLPAINVVLQHVIERATVEFLPAILAAVGPNSSLASDPGGYKLILEVAG